MNRNYTNLLIASVFVLLASCATLTEEQKYERADRLVQAREQFSLKEISCRNSGAKIVMRRSMASRLYRYSRHDYDSAECLYGRNANIPMFF